MQTNTRRWQSSREHMWGWSFEASATNRKRLMRVLGYSKQWVSRVIREGEGPYGTFFADVEKMGAAPDTDPSPMLATAFVLATRPMFEGVDGPDVDQMLRIAMQQEESSEARCNPIALHYLMLDRPTAADRRELFEAQVEEVARELTVLAICAELDRRAIEAGA